ncbi:ABC transporter permease [Tumebacillus sp. ITR2]|uniref:ABC transporter permease n=1 Tax=Tumebacillus amylolyticus TaxID=2801339 RepID=A0ABS1JB76_9BACL|nr:ABC transporter permease [Tumebacillus amylolyticus]MBL0387506.1 ABC transporter permease [Tumebacillus amylolyticus]
MSEAGKAGKSAAAAAPYGVRKFHDIGDLYGARAKRAWLQGVFLMMSILRNQGVLLAAITVVIGSAFGYKAGLDRLPASFPTAWFIAILTAFVACRGRVRTFLQEPDLVFLLPAEERMGAYYRHAGRYSAFFQGLQALVWVGLFVPLFQARIGLGVALLCAVGVLVLKLWNLWMSWRQMVSVKRFEATIVVRFLGNALFVYGIVALEWVAMLGGVLVLGLVTVLLARSRRVRSLPWNELLDLEQQTLSTYYTIASFFVEVPKLKNRVKRRAWIMALVRRIPINQKLPYLYLYIRTFFRYSEYFGIYLRLMAFVGVILYFIPNVWVALVVFLLGLFLMGFQLPNLASEQRYSELVRIYPLTDQDKKRGISWLALQLLVAESLLLSLLLLISGRVPLQHIAWMPLAGLLFSLYIAFYYLPNRFIEEEKKT